MGHLLDRCPFASTIWDKGAICFRRSDRRRGQPEKNVVLKDPESLQQSNYSDCLGSFPRYGHAVHLEREKRSNLP